MLVAMPALMIVGITFMLLTIKVGAKKSAKIKMYISSKFLLHPLHMASAATIPDGIVCWVARG